MVYRPFSAIPHDLRNFTETRSLKGLEALRLTLQEG